MDKFFAISEPTRRNIIEMLANGTHLSATQIYDHFDVSQSAISQHLKVLKEANIVKVEKHAQHRIYTLNTDAIEEIETWTKTLHQGTEEKSH